MLTPIHVIPMNEEHTDNLNCWCNPKGYKICDDCDGQGCWKCITQPPALVGMIETTIDVSMVVHNLRIDNER